MQRLLGALARVDLTIKINKHRLAGGNIPDQFIAQHIERHAFGGNHMIRSCVAVAAAVHNGTYPERITKCQDAEADDHRHDRIGAPATSMNCRHRLENVSRRQTQASNRFQFVCEHV